MQIRYLGKAKFDIKTKDASVFLDLSVSVNGFLLPGAGEYEKNGIFVEGIQSNGDTIYLVRADDVVLCYLGKISGELKDSEIKEIGDVDILFVPLGEESSVDVKKAIAIISKIDPKVVIPMLYADFTEFKKSEEIAVDNLAVLKVKKEDLSADDRKNIVLSPQN